MANYPDAALNLQADLNQIFSAPPPSGSGPFESNLYVGATQEEAAEDAIIHAIEQYTNLADGRTCNKVTVWKIIPDWPNHDSDFSLAITSGQRTNSISMKAIVPVSDGKFSLLLYDYSTAGGPTQYTGSVTQDSGRWTFTPNRPDTPQTPAPVHPWDDSDNVPA
jgi:hypothetical protein